MAASRDLSILIVDEYRAMRKILRGLLQQLGFHDIDEASDSQAAYDMICAKDYCVVISDWNVAPITGLELLKRVRAEARTANLPFIMVTAEAKAENVVAACEAGVSNFIVKPFTQIVLRQRLAAVLGEQAISALRPRAS